jgi:hypothetical protein
MTPPGSAQQSADLLDVLSSEFTMSREARCSAWSWPTAARSKCRFATMPPSSMAAASATAPRGGPLDRAWRDLLNNGMDVPSARPAALLADWEATGDVGGRMNQALEAALRPAAAGCGSLTS